MIHIKKGSQSGAFLRFKIICHIFVTNLLYLRHGSDKGKNHEGSYTAVICKYCFYAR